MPDITLQLEPMWGFGFDEVVTIADALEAAGWHGLSVSDHIFWNRDGVDRNCFEAWTLLAALAPITSTLRLSTLVTANSYRQPSLLAKMAAGIDNISGADIARDPATVDRSVFLFTAVVDSAAEIDAIAAQLDERLDGAGSRFVKAGTSAGVIGSADQVVEGLQAHLATGFSGLHLLFPFGHETDLIARYTSEVLPHLV